MFQKSRENAGDDAAVRGYLSARMQCEGIYVLDIVENVHSSCFFVSKNNWFCLLFLL